MHWVSSPLPPQIARATAVFSAFSAFTLALCGAGNNQFNNGNGRWADTGSWTNGNPQNDVAVVAAGDSVTVDATDEAAALQFSGGTINATTELRLTGNNGAGSSTWTGGDFTGSGRVKFEKGVTISGTDAKRVQGGAKLDIGLAAGSLTNTTWSEGTIQTGGSATAITNKTQSKLIITFDGTMSNTLGGGTASFVNQGILEKNTATGTTEFQTIFDNAGTMDVKTGKLQASSGGSNTGAITIRNGAAFRVTNGYSFEAASSVNAESATGTGKVEIAGGTVQLKGASGSARYEISNGTATLTSTNTTSQELALSGGTVNGSGKFNVGQFKFTGGELTDSNTEIAATGGSEISGANNALVRNGAKLTLGGATNWTANTLNTGGSSTLITNGTGGTFTTSFDGVIADNQGGGKARFNNQGAFNKNGGTATSDIQTVFDNSGTVSVTSGKLQLSGGGTHTGSMTVGAGSAIRLSANTYNFESGSTAGGDGTYELTGAAVNFKGVGGNGKYAMSGGTATLTGTNNTTGEFALGAGTVMGGGKFNVAKLKFTGGDLADSSEISATGQTEISGTGAALIRNGAKLTLDGSTSWTANMLNTGGSSTSITNKTGGTFTNGFDGTIANNQGGGRASFTNQGTFRKNGGSGTTDIQTSFSNTGTIEVSTGKVELSGGGSSSGRVSLSNSASLRLSGFGFNFSNGAEIDGNGQLEMNTTVSFAGTTRGSARHQVQGGTVSFDGAHTVTGGLDLAGGFVGGVGSLIVDSFLDWSGGELSGLTLQGKGNGAIRAGAATRLRGNSQLELEGATSWEGNTIETGDSGTRLTNKAGGSFSTNFDGTIANNLGGGRARFVNQGQFIKNGGGAGYTDVQAEFENNGSVTVGTGKLKLSGGGRGAGSYNIGNGAMIRLEGSDYAFDSGAAINGDGILELFSGNHAFHGNTGGNARNTMKGGNATLNGNHGSGRFDLEGGRLGGNGALGVNGKFNWTNGELDGPTVNANNGSTINGGSLKISNGARLNLGGQTAWISGVIETGGSTTEIVNKNNGTFTVNFDGTVANNLGGGTAKVTNNGTFTKNGGSGTTDIQTVFVNNNGLVEVATGTLRFSNSFVQTAGTISLLNHSTLKVDNGLSLAAGELNGSGTVIGNVVNHGLINPGFSPGRLDITGDLSLVGTSAVLLEIGGRSQGVSYDLLAVSGNANLGGLLQVKFLNDFNTSILSTDSFTILTAANVSGAFSNAAIGGRIMTADGVGSFLLGGGAGALTLSDFQPVPEPGTWALMLAGIPLAIRGLRRRRR